MINRTLAPLALAISLSGCALSSPHGDIVSNLPHSYANTPSAGIASKSETNASGSWIKGYKDPELLRLINLAMGNVQAGVDSNMDIEIAKARVAQSIAAFRQAQAGRWPSLDFGLSGQKQSVHNGVARSHSSEFGSMLNASWLPDFWGQISNQIRAQETSLHAETLGVEQLKRVVRFQIMTQYFTLRQMEAETRLVEEQLEDREKLLEIMEKRFEFGVGTELEVEQTRALLASLHRAKLELDTTRFATLSTLSLLTGDVALTVRPCSAPVSRLTLPALGLPSDLLVQRYDIREAELALQASGHEIAAARAALLPSIKLTAQGGARSADLRSLLGAGSSFWSIGMNIDVPIFDKSRRIAKVDQFKAIRDERIANYKKTIQSAFVDVNNALITLENLEKQKGHMSNEIESARLAWSMAKAQYEAGLIGYSELLDAEQAMAQAKQAESRLFFSTLIAQGSIYNTLGL